MFMRIATVAILGALAAETTLAAPADRPVSESSTKEAGSDAKSSAAEMRSLGRQLGNPSFRQRQRAFERLLSAGHEALPVLADAARSPDREVRSRALSILVALAASRTDAVATAAQTVLDELKSVENRGVSSDVSEALLQAQAGRTLRAIADIRAGGGVVTATQADEPTVDALLAVEIGARWKRGSAGLKPLSELSNVTWLSLEGAPVDDSALAFVGQLPRLEKLYLRQTRIRGPGLSHLSRLSSLTHLSLRELPIDDAALAALPDLPKLTDLGLDRTAITNDGLAELARFTSLDTLWLDNTQITDAGLAHLGKLKNLHTLYLTGTKTAGPGLANLKELASLRYLSLKEVELPPGSTRQLSQLTQLEILGLDHTNVSDQQLADLSPLTSLRTLWLSKTPVTDEGIEHLKQLKSLQRVYFHGSQVTAAGREALRKALPDCRVEPEDDRPGSGRPRR